MRTIECKCSKYLNFVSNNDLPIVRSNADDILLVDWRTRTMHTSLSLLEINPFSSKNGSGCGFDLFLFGESDNCEEWNHSQ